MTDDDSPGGDGVLAGGKHNCRGTVADFGEITWRLMHGAVLAGGRENPSIREEMSVSLP